MSNSDDELDALFANPPDTIDPVTQSTPYSRLLELQLKQYAKTIEQQGRELAAYRYERGLRDNNGRLIDKLQRRVAALKHVVRSREWGLAQQWWKDRDRWQSIASQLYELIPEGIVIPEEIEKEFEIPF